MGQATTSLVTRPSVAKVTIFDILYAWFSIAGSVSASEVLGERYGLFAAIVGGAGGFALGFGLAHAVTLGALKAVGRYLASLSLKEVRSRLKSDPYQAHIMAQELDRRGELSMDDLLLLCERLWTGDPTTRQHAWTALGCVRIDLCHAASTYNPCDSSEACKRHALSIVDVLEMEKSLPA